MFVCYQIVFCMSYDSRTQTNVHLSWPLVMKEPYFLFQGRNPLGLESCLFVSPTTWRMLLYIGKKNLPHQANIYISLVLHKMVYKPICHVKPCTLWEKKYHKAHFRCFRLSQIKDSIQYLEGPNCTWAVHDKNIFCPNGPQDSYHGPSKYNLVLPGTE